MWLNIWRAESGSVCSTTMVLCPGAWRCKCHILSVLVLHRRIASRLSQCQVHGLSCLLLKAQHGWAETDRNYTVFSVALLQRKVSEKDSIGPPFNVKKIIVFKSQILHEFAISRISINISNLWNPNPSTWINLCYRGSSNYPFNTLFASNNFHRAWRATDAS